MKIFFIRHGETTGDVEDRFGGDYDDQLSEKGQEQTLQLVESLKNGQIQKVFSSPLIRAKETAAMLAKSLGGDYTVFPEFKERNQFGILAGMVRAEAKEKYPEIVEALQDYRNTVEGAESYEDFSSRVASGFDRLVNQIEVSELNTVAVVWHGGPMRVLFRDILKWGELKEIGTGAFVELKQTEGKWVMSSASGIVFDF